MAQESNDEQVASVGHHILKRTFWQLVDRVDVGKKELDPFRLKTLKGLLKSDQCFVEPLIVEIFKALHRQNSETRLGAVLLVNEIFLRSSRFRELLIDDFQDFLLLTAETDAIRWPLPDPKDVSKDLKLFTMKSVQKWHEKYGQAYRKLDLAFNYLKECKTLDFQHMEAQTLVERRRWEVEERRKARIREEISGKIERDMKEWERDCGRCLSEMKNAVQLVYPVFIETDTSETTKGTLQQFLTYS